MHISRGAIYLLVYGLAAVLLLIGVDPARAVELEGLLEPSETIEISSQVPGVIDEMLVERGDQVQSGQVIAKLKSGVEGAAVALAQARVEFGERKSKRNEELSQKKLISSHETDEIETELKIARLELREAEERLTLRVIRSPIDGVVVARKLGPGEYVGENPILTIARIDPLYVEVIAPAQLFGKIRTGANARVRPEGPLGGSHPARVIVVDRVIDAASGTFGIRLELPNKERLLPAGLMCRVNFSN